MDNRDYDDPDVEEKWCAAARNEVIEYLALHGVEHGEVGEWPAWHVAPVVSVWAIESVAKPGCVGWWTLFGDLPTDYVSAAQIKHPREAVRAIAARWADYVAAVRRGEPPGDYSIGRAAPSDELLSLLQARAELLFEWANDDSVWEPA